LKTLVTSRKGSVRWSTETNSFLTLSSRRADPEHPELI
jgi:hypothetical protein